MSNEIIRLLHTKEDFIGWFIGFYGLEDYYEFEYPKLAKGLMLNNINLTKLSLELEASHKVAPEIKELNQLAKRFENKVDTSKCKSLQHIQFIKNESFPGKLKDLPEELKEKIRAFKLKNGIKGIEF